MAWGLSREASAGGRLRPSTRRFALRPGMTSLPAHFHSRRNSSCFERASDTYSQRCTHRFAHQIYRSRHNHDRIVRARAAARARSRALFTFGHGSISAPVRAAACWISSGDADRGFSGRVAITRTASGNRISVISEIALSRIAPKTKISGRSSYRSERAERKAQAPAGLCATSSTISGHPSRRRNDLKSSRPMRFANPALDRFGCDRRRSLAC